MELPHVLTSMGLGHGDLMLLFPVQEEGTIEVEQLSSAPNISSIKEGRHDSLSQSVLPYGVSPDSSRTSDRAGPDLELGSTVHDTAWQRGLMNMLHQMAEGSNRHQRHQSTEPDPTKLGLGCLLSLLCIVAVPLLVVACLELRQSKGYYGAIDDDFATLGERGMPIIYPDTKSSIGSVRLHDP